MLKTPSGTATRPLLARIKKSLFDILAPRLPGSRVLDVYAGCGSFGIEAVSRGASEAVLVEKADRAARAIMDNIARLGGRRGRTRLIRRDAPGAMISLADGGEEFDIVFLDPPFGEERDAELLGLAASLLAPGGMVLLRVPRDRPDPGVPAGQERAISLVREKRYGASTVRFYVKGGIE